LNQRPPPCQGSLSSKEITIPEGGQVKSSEHKPLGNYKATYSQDFWSGFQSYLSKNNNHLGTRDRLNYAMKYVYILETGDARQLLELSHEKRMHIMKSLSALAKYTGHYDTWQRIRQRFQLKWSNCDSLQTFSSIFNKEKDLDHMVSWLKDTCSKLPQKYTNIMMFNTLTGLRPSEAYLSISLIQDNLEHYLNNDTKILEHFRFPDFIRRTKKAYISIINDRILEMAKSVGRQLITYNQLKLQFKHHSVNAIHMLYCRKIFATYLRLSGVEQETIDLLQGRIPRNVFVRHYFRPNFEKENTKVSVVLDNLSEKIRNTA
jgi:Archaeal phage integrase